MNDAKVKSSASSEASPNRVSIDVDVASSLPAYQQPTQEDFKNKEKKKLNKEIDNRHPYRDINAKRKRNV